MAKLYFRYGAMGCSKTANALMVAFNYEEKGLHPLLLKPKLDTRDGKKIIKSRIGLSRKCEYIEDFIVVDMQKTLANLKEYDCIVIDEVQFCTLEQIKMLPKIIYHLHIPIMCYGLKTDFLLRPFLASQELLVLADKVEELKTVCWCGDGATCNARIDENGNVVRKGKQIVLGGNDTYVSLCLNHYYRNNIGPKMKARFDNKQ